MTKYYALKHVRVGGVMYAPGEQIHGEMSDELWKRLTEHKAIDTAHDPVANATGPGGPDEVKATPAQTPPADDEPDDGGETGDYEDDADDSGDEPPEDDGGEGEEPPVLPAIDGMDAVVDKPAARKPAAPKAGAATRGKAAKK